VKKIWFDLSNSPHINLFADLINELKKDYEIVITTRELGNSIELLERENLDYTVVGKYYESGKLKKSYAFIDRILKLRKFLKEKNVNLAVSQSSFQSPPVARLLGIKSLYMNDNEHAQGNIPAFIFASKIMLPEYFPKEIAKKQFAKSNKIIFYPGLKEGIYLWNKENLLFNSKVTNKDVIYVRPEPWTAMYYKGEKNFLDNFIKELEEHENVVILPRDKIQEKHYANLKLKSVEIKKGLTLEEIASNCKLFIGAGGTMTREMAVLGYPTISVYQEELLSVDKFLLNQGALVHNKNITVEFVYDYLGNFNGGINSILLKKGNEAYTLLKETILNLIYEE